MCWRTPAYQVRTGCRLAGTLLTFLLFRSKFGRGFQIIIKLKSTKEPKAEETLNALKCSVIGRFDSCLVTDQHLDYIHFHVSNPATSWASLFTSMEAAKTEFPVIQDYSITETTLEQIFLDFARGQAKGNLTAVTVL